MDRHAQKRRNPPGGGPDGFQTYLRWEEDAQATIRIRPGRRWAVSETFASLIGRRGEDPTADREMPALGGGCAGTFPPWGSGRNNPRRSSDLFGARRGEDPAGVLGRSTSFWEEDR